MPSRLLDFLKKDPLAYAEYLSRLSYDELVEVDLRKNICRNLEHVAGSIMSRSSPATMTRRTATPCRI